MYLNANNPDPRGSCGKPVTNSFDEHVEDTVARRVSARLPKSLLDFMTTYKVTSFFVAGGACLRQQPEDVDVWPAPSSGSEFLEAAKSVGPGTAPSMKFDAVVVQFCGRGEVKQLGELVESFDFAHCQAGVRFDYLKNAKTRDEGWYAVDVHLTDHWKAAVSVGGTYYCGGRWPLRSLSRVPGIAQKLGLTRSETRELAMQVCADTVDNTGLAEALKAEAE